MGNIDFNSLLGVLTTLILLSLLLERALFILFDYLPLRTFLARPVSSISWFRNTGDKYDLGKAIKPLVTLAISAFFCFQYKIDAFQAATNAPDAKLWGFGMTALILTGGSATIMKLFNDVLNLGRTSIEGRREIRRLQLAAEQDEARAKAARSAALPGATEQSKKAPLVHQPIFQNPEPITDGSSGADVRRLQDYLKAYGYLENNYEVGVFDAATKEGLKRYQEFTNLKADGLAGSVTKEQIEKPRCGFPDIPILSSGSTGDAATIGTTYGTYSEHQLTYSFYVYPDEKQITKQAIQRITQECFEAWAPHCGKSFVQVADISANATFKFYWVRGSHTDHRDFDGDWEGSASNVLAHAFPPDINKLVTPDVSHDKLSRLSGELHFDADEPWVTDNAVSNSEYPIRVRQIILHEIGHALGLGHSVDPNDIMFSIYSGHKPDFLTPNDKNWMLKHYGM